jgi:long-chain-fatty-acid---luciferin-component ligase
VELSVGSRGSIVILDALNTAYPGFLLTDDLGEVSDASCMCGRRGQTVRFSGRRQGAELGCCAVSIERYMAGVEAAAVDSTVSAV